MSFAPSRLVAHADVSEETNISALLVNLWNLTRKHGVVDNKLLVSGDISVQFKVNAAHLHYSYTTAV